MQQNTLVSPDQLDLFLIESEPELYLDPGRWGFFSVFTRKPGTEKWSGRQESYQLRDLPTVVPMWQKRGIELGLDVYITQAAFAKPNRRKVNLASMGQLFVDLDYYRATSLRVRYAEPEEVLELVCQRCDKVGLPYPSVVMFSGQGIYLKWLHEYLPAKVLKKWEWAQQYLNAVFEDFGADSNAKDVSRVLRLENTLNHKTKMKTEIMTVNTINGQIANYSFNDDLCSILLPHTDAECKVFKEKMQSLKKEIANRKRKETILRKKVEASGIVLDSKKVFGYKKLNHSRYLDLVKLCHMRFGLGGADDGFRDQFLWMACNYFALANQARTGLDMWHEFYQIATLIAPHWSQGRIRNCLGVIYSKYKQAAGGETVQFAGKEYSPLYTHKNRTLIDDLGITKEEQRQLSTLISVGVKNERHAKYEKSRRQANGAVDRLKYDSQRKEKTQVLASQVQEMLKTGLKGKEVAEKLGITGARVSQLKKLNGPCA